MADRRSFLAGLLATGLCPTRGWADLGNPAYLAAARLPSGKYALFGLSNDGAPLFQIPLPNRGHASAAHPYHAVAVAFARRPGTFALVINCTSGTVIARLTAPGGHHFSGHGTFSADGGLLFTAENDFENARGMVGVWRTGDYARLTAFSSGGIGPHDLKLMPDGRRMVVANGGIETHPDTGRTKLNLPTMRPNLTYLSLDGVVADQIEPPVEWHKNSIRHLAVHGDGRVAIACQWQGDLSDVPPLLATHDGGAALAFRASGHGYERRMQGYAGSIAVSRNSRIAVTGPRGGLALIFDRSGQFQDTITEQDICGVAPAADDLAFTTGLGRVLFPIATTWVTREHDLQWDNHLIAIAG
ncbi:DUF1513 domain-containing protein [Actibacterium sp. 188UL27-1]|uniref:DUF1513 domain-containing protein n=1 Tax=Actibacterium sp. 188UL27-1 TaxID=2786961 RepID=UPI00195C2D03|nr:DUF1513 domain-containing protein [Actibacterium sp. 188UL27-1]MBM7067085.1 DUF1513 domain-containing protein [Actibacterium sp. 188UL27-1]